MIDWGCTNVLLTGGAGFLGRAVSAVLVRRGVTPDRIHIPRSATSDLRDSRATDSCMSDFLEATNRTSALPMIIHAAGRVGGLGANKRLPAVFFHDNMAMALNLVRAANEHGIVERGGRLVFVGSMTSYPADAPVPFREDDLFRGYPDAASAPYAIAKLAALELLRAYHTQYGLQASYVIPVNLYGPGDNLDPTTSHVVGALVDRCVRATRAADSSIECWGTGSPTRDFLFIDDAAEGIVSAAERITSPFPINLGSGAEYSIRQLVELIVRFTQYKGEVVWDRSKPDGVGRRCLDVSRAHHMLGWRAQVTLEEGIRRTVEWRVSLAS